AAPAPPPSEINPAGAAAGELSQDDGQSAAEWWRSNCLPRRRKYKEADERAFAALPQAPFLREWKRDVIKKRRAASGRPDEAFEWMGEEAQVVGKRMRRRQNFHRIFDWHKLVEADACVCGFAHLQAVKMVDQDAAGSIYEWGYTIMGAKSAQEESSLISLFKAEVEKQRSMEVDMGEFNRTGP
ncbi:unnamed protein product, partial [Prorocentrum cordatum]